MMTEWRDFLITQGARVDAHGHIAFPEPQSSSECHIFDLSQLGLIAVDGADAKTLLQGQLTSDLREISETYTQIGGLCNQKGRILALLRIFQLGDTVYLQTPVERLAKVLERLRIFVLRSKVSLEDASDTLIRIGLAGDRAPDLLADQGLTPPEQDNVLSVHGDLAVMRLSAPVPRFEILGPLAAMTALWTALSRDATPANPPGWTLLDIQAGLPNVYDATAEAFIPQMTNLHLIHGVSFHKGCYTGQEVVARMQFLGKLKRRMYLAEVDADIVAPQPGDELFTSQSTSQQASGRVVDAAPLPDGRYALLVVAEIAAVDGGEFRLGEHGPALSLREPPYGFPAAEV